MAKTKVRLLELKDYNSAIDDLAPYQCMVIPQSLYDAGFDCFMNKDKTEVCILKLDEQRLKAHPLFKEIEIVG